jgi:hypothetical protein
MTRIETNRSRGAVARREIATYVNVGCMRSAQFATCADRQKPVQSCNREEGRASTGDVLSLLKGSARMTKSLWPQQHR